MHSLDHELPDWPAAKKVATIHDMYAHLRIDYQHPQDIERRQSQYKQLIETADHLVCVSESTKRDLLKFYSFPDQNISVVHHGVDERFNSTAAPEDLKRLKELNLQRPYLLFVGALKSSKNVARLIAAFDEYKIAVDYDLVLAGDGPEKEQLKEQALTTKHPESIKFLGFVDDDKIPTLYRHAQGFCLVSLYEGFGLPIIEALKSGTPVLTTNIGGAADIAGEHATQCDPRDTDSIGKGLTELLQLDGKLAEKSLEYANSFTWENTAIQTAEVYQKVLAEP